MAGGKGAMMPSLSRRSTALSLAGAVPGGWALTASATAEETVWRIADCGLRIADWSGWRIADCGLRIADWSGSAPAGGRCWRTAGPPSPVFSAASCGSGTADGPDSAMAGRDRMEDCGLRIADCGLDGSATAGEMSWRTEEPASPASARQVADRDCGWPRLRAGRRDGCELRIADCELRIGQAGDCGLRIANCGLVKLRSADGTVWELRIADLRIADCGIADCGLRIADWIGCCHLNARKCGAALSGFEWRAVRSGADGCPTPQLVGWAGRRIHSSALDWPVTVRRFGHGRRDAVGRAARRRTRRCGQWRTRGLRIAMDSVRPGWRDIPDGAAMPWDG